jgi:hypothetical protein
VAGCCEHGSESSAFIKCGEFLDKVRNVDPAPVKLLCRLCGSD